MSVKTTADYPRLSKLLLVAANFDEKTASQLLASLVKQVNENGLLLEDCDNINDMCNWSKTLEGGDFWCDYDNALERAYEDVYCFPFGFPSGVLDEIIEQHNNQ